MRIELLMTLLAGFAGGLVGTLWAGVVSAPLAARWPALRLPAAEPETATRLLAGALLAGLCGAAGGLLFWLSWGLVAVVSAPWQVVGASYGALLWAAAALPALGMLAARSVRLRGPAALLALEVLVSCLAVGLLCAWVWHRSV